MYTYAVVFRHVHPPWTCAAAMAALPVWHCFHFQTSASTATTGNPTKAAGIFILRMQQVLCGFSLTRFLCVQQPCSAVLLCHWPLGCCTLWGASCLDWQDVGVSARQQVRQTSLQTSLPGWQHDWTSCTLSIAFRYGMPWLLPVTRTPPHIVAYVWPVSPYHGWTQSHLYHLSG